MVTVGAARPAMTRHDRALAWQVPAGWLALSSASVGGGLVRPRWVLNVEVRDDFGRTDLEAYAAEVAGRLGLDGQGCALLTAADVGQVEHVRHEDVDAWATVGVTRPTWAARPGAAPRSAPPPVATAAPGTAPPPATGPPPPGTVNLVVAVPVPLSASALVQAVGTATEAKAQALVEAGVPGTGTASDALVVLAPEPAGEAVPFAGVRSTWGQRVARAVHGTVAAGLADRPWPPPGADTRVVW